MEYWWWLAMEERIKDIEEILTDIVNGRSVNLELQKRLEERISKHKLGKGLATLKSDIGVLKATK